MKRSAVVALLILVVSGFGCRRRENRRRRSGDVRIRVELTREFVRSRMRRVERTSEPEEDEWDVRQREEEEEKEEERRRRERRERYRGKKTEEKIAGYAFEFFAEVFIAPLFSAMFESMFTAGTTKGYIWPKKDKRKYCQRLYWGKNKVYLPGKYKGKRVPMIVRFKGNYEGRLEFILDLERKKKVKF